MRRRREVQAPARPVVGCNCQWAEERPTFICSGHGGCARHTAARRPVVGDAVECFREDGRIAIGVVFRIGTKYLHLLICRPGLRVVKYPRTWIRRTIAGTKGERLRRIRALAVTGMRYGSTAGARRALVVARRGATTAPAAPEWDTEITTAALARAEPAKR